MRIKRCHWYDDNGLSLESSRGNGCRNPMCTFAHPWQDTWAAALPSHTPSGPGGPGLRSRSFTRSNENTTKKRNRSHSSSPPTPRRKRFESPSPSPDFHQRRLRDKRRSASPRRSPSPRRGRSRSRYRHRRTSRSRSPWSRSTSRRPLLSTRYRYRSHERGSRSPRRSRSPSRDFLGDKRIHGSTDNRLVAARDQIRILKPEVRSNLTQRSESTNPKDVAKVKQTVSSRVPDAKPRSQNLTDLLPEKHKTVTSRPQETISEPSHAPVDQPEAIKAVQAALVNDSDGSSPRSSLFRIIRPTQKASSNGPAPETSQHSSTKAEAKLAVQTSATSDPRRLVAKKGILLDSDNDGHHTAPAQLAATLKVATTNDQPSSPDNSTSELWDRRVSVLSTAVLACTAGRRVDQKLAELQTSIKSSKPSDIDKKTASEEQERLQNRRSRLQRDLSQAVNRLAASGTWFTTIASTSDNFKAVEESTVMKVLTRVEQLSSQMQDMDRRLDARRASGPTIRERPQQASGNQKQEQGLGNRSSAAARERSPDTKDLILRLSGLDKRMSDLVEGRSKLPEELSRMLERCMDQKLGDLFPSTSKSIGRELEVTIRRLDEDIKKTGEEITEISDVIVQLYKDQDQLFSENQALLGENIRLKKQAIADRQAQMEMKVLREEVDELTRKCAAYEQDLQMRQEASSPEGSFAQVEEILQPFLRQLAREHMQPIIQQTQEDVERMMQASSDQFLANITPGITATRQIGDTLLQWVQRMTDT